jgi:hypothetical protein
MKESAQTLKEWIAEIEKFIGRNEDINVGSYIDFTQNQEIAVVIIDFINAIEDKVDEFNTSYSAHLFALDVCVSQLQSVAENGNKTALKTLKILMNKIAESIRNNNHGLGFWLPILSPFYEAHVDLTDELKESYFLLANFDDEKSDVISEETSHLDSIRALISDLSEMSEFDIAENFFAQSCAMPDEFFIDLVLDLYNLDEGRNIALLALLHPRKEVREVVVATIDSIIESITLSPKSLSRLQVIASWYPKEYLSQMESWIRIQRKKGVIFHRETPKYKLVHIKASEIDGGGAQGIFVQIRCNKKQKLCSLLLKRHVGVKDAWVTQFISNEEIKNYYKDAFDDGVFLRQVDLEYFIMMTNHFLAVMLENGDMPDLHLLEIQEELGVKFYPEKIDVDDIIQKLIVSINPFTSEVVEKSYSRSKNWLYTKKHTESWFLESHEIDKLVNKYSSYSQGSRVTQFFEVVDAVLNDYMEQHRDDWVMHFLMVALWSKVKARPTEVFWHDSLIIAYSIYKGEDLASIPIFKTIAKETVMNSIKTMKWRGTHLSS